MLKRFDDEWKMYKVGDIFEVRKGSIITERDVKKGSIPVIAGGKKPAYYHNIANRKGNVITISASGANAGFVSFYLTPIFASDCITITTNNENSIQLLYYILNSMQKNIYEMQTGGAQPHVYPISIMNLDIKLPKNIEEQRKIVSVLINIDNLIEDYEKLIKKKEKIKQGLMQNLLTGKVRLKGYDKKWIIKELKELGNIVTGTTPSRNNKHYWNGNINWITAQDFKGKYIAESVEKISAEGAKSCRMLPKNSVIVTCIASIGLNAIITKESATNQQINGIICNEHYDNEFIYYSLSYYNEYIWSFASQTAVPIINKRVFEEITILLPMEKQEQQAISKVLSNADNEISDLKLKLDKIKNIKKGMMDNLLTGKIRL